MPDKFVLLAQTNRHAQNINYELFCSSGKCWNDVEDVHPKKQCH